MLHKKWLNALLPVILLIVLAVPGADKPKLDPEELVRLHLEAVGTSESLAERKSVQADGSSTLTIVTSGSGQLQGPATLVSDGKKLRLSIIFGINDYPAEEVCYDGKSVDVGYLAPGIRSPLGDFLYQFEEIVEQGLFAGVVSTAWPLFDLEGREPRLDYEGLKKVDGEEFHTLKYRPRKGGEVTTKLYFDQETFRHAFTIHQVRLRPRPGRDSSWQQETRSTLKETFTEFRTIGGLTLPVKWSVELSTESGQSTRVLRWDTNYTGFGFNPEIEPDRFILR